MTMDELTTYAASALAVLIVIFRRQLKAWFLQALRSAQEPPAALQAPAEIQPAPRASGRSISRGGLLALAFGTFNAGLLCYGALAGNTHWAWGVFGAAMLAVFATFAYFGLRHR